MSNNFVRCVSYVLWVSLFLQSCLLVNAGSHTIASSIYTNEKKGFSPDDFIGKNDSEKLQKAIDYAVNNNISVICIDRRYDISGATLYINKGINQKDNNSTYSRKKLHFQGICEAELYKGDSGYMFSSKIQSGDISFSNIIFSGRTKNDKDVKDVEETRVFDCNKLIRLSLINNSFIWCESVYYQDKSVSNDGGAMQSIVSIGNLYVKNKYVFTIRDAYDIRFISDTFEDGYSIVKPCNIDATIRSCKIVYCCVEGFTKATALNFHCVVTGLEISSNYFEANLNHIVADRFFTGCINNNQFHGRGNIEKDKYINCIKVAPHDESCSINGNSLVVSDENTCLLTIDTKSAYYNPKISILGQNYAEGRSVFTNEPHYIRKSKGIQPTDQQIKQLDLSEQLKLVYPSIVSGEVFYSEANGVKIITLNNVKIVDSISGCTMDAFSDRIIPGIQHEFNSSIVDKTTGNSGVIYVTLTGGFGIRVSTAGTYCGQIVYN